MADDNRFESAGIEGLFDFSFRRFITLNVIKVLYGLALALIALAWAIAVLRAGRVGAEDGLVVAIFGGLVAVINVIVVRITLELIVVLFRIGENTSRMVEQRGDSEGPPPTA